MLHSLTVKNVALIDALEIDFTNGLNILTGETGAGKSVLIGSINLALGEKADASLIRDGAESALIEMTFGLTDTALIKEIRAMEIDVQDDGQLVLQRRIYPNRSVCKVSGETVTLKQLRALARLLISIHGQNDQTLMLRKDAQTELLDRYGEKEIAPVKEELAASFRNLKETTEALNALSGDEKLRQREIDLLRYEIEEIDQASLTVGEDETLEERFRKLSALDKISEALHTAVQALSGDEGALSHIAYAYRSVSDAVRADQSLKDIASEIGDAEQILSDASRAMEDYLSGADADENALNETTERLNLVNRLKEKYDERSGGIAAILEYRDRQEARLSDLEDFEASKTRAEKALAEAKAKALQSASRLSRLRAKYAKDLTVRLKEALSGLNFADVQFAIDVTSDEAHLTANGCDEISFLISTNPGEKMRPLEQIASGGELSRIMLGIQTVLGRRDENLAMIFDEIDAGISGKTAWKVSGKLSELSANRQVICITHLAQIAAMADTHYRIRKEVTGGRSVTRIDTLSEEETIAELARLLGTDEIGETALESARAMRAEALAMKRKKEPS